jgi:hypothetical protein
MSGRCSCSPPGIGDLSRLVVRYGDLGLWCAWAAAVASTS